MQIDSKVINTKTELLNIIKEGVNPLDYIKEEKDIDFVFSIDDNDVTASTNNQNSNNNNNNENENEEVEEEATPQEELEVKVTFSSIIALIVVFGIIGGLIYLKYKTSAKARFSKKNINNPSVLYHNAPPNNKK